METLKISVFLTSFHFIDRDSKQEQSILLAHVPLCVCMCR